MKLSQKDQNLAFYYWWNLQYPAQEADLAVTSFLKVPSRPEIGWLKASREALLKSSGELAKQVGCSRQAVTQFEQKELEGKITLETLARLAEAMDCELVYAIRPKKKLRFSQLIWEKLLSASEGHGWIRHAKEPSKFRALAKIAGDRFRDSDFRKENQWNKRKTRPSKSLKAVSIAELLPPNQ